MSQPELRIWAGAVGRRDVRSQRCAKCEARRSGGNTQKPSVGHVRIGTPLGRESKKGNGRDNGIHGLEFRGRVQARDASLIINHLYIGHETG